MKIEIFDVEHGQCAMIHCPNGKKLMIDAGHNSSRPWYPSIHFFGDDIERLVITNYDHDHTSDLVDVKRCCNVNVITRNPSISSASLSAMKAQTGMGPGIKDIYQWLKDIEANPGGFAASANLGLVTTTTYWNTYGYGVGQFTDANNLSVVTFVHFQGFCILFPGDLEEAGWQQLLKNPNFREDLKKVTVLVASHHGRRNGFCADVFNYCAPRATIISDAGKQHATQETVHLYSYRTVGYQHPDGSTRKVLTTRTDGAITIDVNFSGMGTVTTERQSNSLSRALGLP